METSPGGITVTHTGLPIMVRLANTAVSFSCRINHQDTPDFKDFTVNFFHEDLHGKRSSEKPIDCQHSPGAENQTLDCVVKLSLPNASATGTYYCSVQGPISAQGSGTFILVRETDVSSGKCLTRTCRSQIRQWNHKAPAESIYTGLQPRETEVYAYIEGETGNPVSSQSSPSKDKLNRFEEDNEFNLVYENL
ncbi:hypothetical protein STEG23_017667 [Scotinomys teguina]